MPRIHVVQSEAYAAVVEAWRRGLTVPELTGSGPTLAEGVACRLPLRGRTILEVLRSSGGVAVTVSDQEIRAALMWLAGAGWYLRRTNGRRGGGRRDSSSC